MTRRTVTVKVPPGIESGKKLKCVGGGSQKNLYQEPGDLFVIITVVDDLVFKRDVETLTYKAVVSPFDLIVGKTIMVPTIDGAVLAVDVRPGSQPSSKIRIPGRGMRVVNTDARGHLFIEFVVELPEGLTEKHKSMIREIQKELAETADAQKAMHDAALKAAFDAKKKGKTP